MFGRDPYPLRINHQCHLDAPFKTYSLYRLLTCYKALLCWRFFCKLYEIETLIWKPLNSMNLDSLHKQKA